jgi:V/A-type H+-transporting ATPase subunit I
MAVSQMQRVQIFAHSSHRASLIKDLQDLEIIHINDLNKGEPDESGNYSEVSAEGKSPLAPLSERGEFVSVSERGEVISELRTVIRGIQNDLSRLQSTIDYLADFEPKKGFVAGLKNGLLGGKIPLSSQKYADITREVAHGEWRSICDECRSLEDQVVSLTNRESRLRSDREHLRLWSNLDVPVEEIRDTEKTAIRIGVVPVNAYDGFLGDLESSEVDVAFEIVGETKTEMHLVVMFLKEDEQEATSILTRHGFSPVSLPVRAGINPGPTVTVADELRRIDEEISGIATQREDIAEKSAQLAAHRARLMAVYDHLTELLRQEEVRETFINTERTFMLDGWVRKRDANKLENELSGKYDEVEIVVSEPSEDDEPPVDLENRRLSNPFQMVTRLYGLPNYGEIDPTPLIAPFFAFFFGICLTDAGYGLVIALIAYFAARKIAGSGRNLFNLLIIAGFVTVLVGAITGGWFGIEIDPEGPLSFLTRIRLLDPKKQQMPFFGAIIAIGFVQVWFGFFVKMYIDIRERDWAGAFYDQLPWLIAMILLAVGAVLYVTEGLTLAVLVAGAVVLLCFLTIIVFAGRESGNPIARIATGGFELYSKLTGTIGDVLSYLRLFALGLATGIIASVVNTMAGMMWGSLIGKVVAVGILAGGHLFNILINALGGFIHTTRLQFVEFFTKFYEGGGEEFQPFRREHTYITVISDE